MTPFADTQAGAVEGFDWARKIPFDHNGPPTALQN